MHPCPWRDLIAGATTALVVALVAVGGREPVLPPPAPPAWIPLGADPLEGPEGMPLPGPNSEEKPSAPPHQAADEHEAFELPPAHSEVAVKGPERDEKADREKQDKPAAQKPTGVSDPPKNAEATPKRVVRPVIDIRANVRCVADMGRLLPDHVTDSIGNEALLVTQNAFYRITPTLLERIGGPPKGRVCVYLPVHRRPAWLLSQLRKAYLGDEADVRMIFSPDAYSELCHVVLSAISEDENFHQTAYEVLVHFEPGLPKARLVVADVTRQPLSPQAHTVARSIPNREP